MAILPVQTAALGSHTSATSQQSGAFPSNPTVGNNIGAWCWGQVDGATPTSVTFTDSGGNSYTVPANVFQVKQTTGTIRVYFAAGYARVTTSAASFKATATVNGTAGGTTTINVCAAEFSGVAATSPLSGTPVGNTSTAAGTFSLGNMTVGAGDLVLCGCTNSDSTGSPPFNFTGSGYTSVAKQVDNAGQVFGIGQGLYAIGPTSPTNPAWSDTNNPVWAGGQFALKAAGGTAYTRAAGDSPQSSSSLTRRYTGGRSLTGAPQTADSPARRSTLARTGGDGPQTSASAARRLVLGRALADAPASDDTSTRRLTLTRSAPDASLGGDTPARVLAASRQSDDHPVAIEEARRTTGAARADADAPQGGDALSTGQARSLAAADAPTIADQAGRVSTSGRTSAETPQTADSPWRQSSVARLAAAASQTRDAVRRAVFGIIMTSDAPRGGDSAATTLGPTGRLSDQPQVSALLQAGQTLIRVVFAASAAAEALSVIVLNAQTLLLRRILRVPAADATLCRVPGGDATLLTVPAAATTLLVLQASDPMSQRKNLQADAGDDLTLAVQVRPVPPGGIAGWTFQCLFWGPDGNVLLTLLSSDTSAFALIDAAAADCNFYVSSQQSGTTLGPGTWNFKLLGFDAAGKQKTLTRGRLTLDGD